MASLKEELISRDNPYWIGVKFSLLSSLLILVFNSTYILHEGYIMFGLDEAKEATYNVVLMILVFLSSSLSVFFLKKTLQRADRIGKVLVGALILPIIFFLGVLLIPPDPSYSKEPSLLTDIVFVTLFVIAYLFPLCLSLYQKLKN